VQVRPSGALREGNEALCSTSRAPKIQFAVHSFNKMENATTKQRFQTRLVPRLCVSLVFAAAVVSFHGDLKAATESTCPSRDQQETVQIPQLKFGQSLKPPSNPESTEDWNRLLRERSASTDEMPSGNPSEYAIGPEDVLDINVFEAQEMNREVRVSASGEISLPLLGAVPVAGLTPRQLETTLEELLHQKFMKDPHVSVFIREVQSHPVSVIGAVRRPGIFQIRGTKTLLEVLSLAEGLADDAGEDVIILRGADGNNETASIFPKPGDGAPLETTQTFGGPGTPHTTDSIPQKVVQVNLKDLLDSTDSRHDPAVYPRDIIKVSRAGIVYVVGAVQRPGGFAMKANVKLSVLQAIALSEGLTRTAAKRSARIIRTNDQSGVRTERPIDLGKILSGKCPDPVLEPRDIVFVPDSAAKSTFSRGAEAAAQTLTGLLIFHW
jgi:polysaccharide biosynthesis/export protein